MNEKFFSLPEEKQQAIINAGYKVFSQNTYHNSPMREIAEAAGIFSQQEGIISVFVGYLCKEDHCLFDRMRMLQPAGAV